MGASDILVYDSLANRENFPQPQSPIRRWLSSVTAGRSITPYGVTEHLATGMSAARQTGESVVVGGLLGALHATLPTGLDIKGMPVDATLGALAMLTAVAMPSEAMTEDLKNAGACGITTYAFRQTYKLLTQKRIAKGEAPSDVPSVTRITGEEDEDPIIRAARRL